MKMHDHYMMHFCIFFLFLLVPLTLSIFDDTPQSRRKQNHEHRHHHDRASDNSHDASEAFLCKWCGHEVFRSSEGFVRQFSPHAISTFPFPTLGVDDNNLTVTAQRLVNPRRFAFDLITTKKAQVGLHGNPVAKDSWFDG